MQQLLVDLLLLLLTTISTFKLFVKCVVSLSIFWLRAHFWSKHVPSMCYLNYQSAEVLIKCIYTANRASIRKINNPCRVWTCFHIWFASKFNKFGNKDYSAIAKCGCIGYVTCQKISLRMSKNIVKWKRMLF